MMHIYLSFSFITKKQDKSYLFLIYFVMIQCQLCGSQSKSMKHEVMINACIPSLNVCYHVCYSTMRKLSKKACVQNHK